MKLRVPALFLAVLCACCCSRPDVEETFVKAGGLAPGAPYCFSVDMTDTLCRYDISFYTRVDVRKKDSAKCPSVGMEIEWVSPSGVRYSEGADMPLDGSGAFSRTGGIVPYRTGLLPVEPGTWGLEVKIPQPPYGFQGLGVIIERKDGSR